MKALAKTDSQAVARFSPDQIDLIKRTICRGANDDELRLFLYQAERTGLDPLARQIYAVKRWDSQSNREVMSIQTSIDGFRLIAERSGKYAGQVGPFWCGSDGEWVDVWTRPEPPVAARVGILRSDFKEPVWGVAKFDSYAQKKKDGTPTRMWQTMADVMTAKCGEALGLRKAFPQELSGLYTSDEMEQVQTAEKVVESEPRKQHAPEPQSENPAQLADDIAKSKGPHELAHENWITFGSGLIEAIKSDLMHADDWMKLNAGAISQMENAAPKVHARMTAAISKLRPTKIAEQSQPLPADDPEKYLDWLRQEVSRIELPSDLQTFQQTQATVWKDAFPPDVSAAMGIFNARAKELEA